MFRKLPTLFLALTLLAAIGFLPTASHSEVLYVAQPPQIDLEIAPSQAGKSSFSDQDESKALSKVTPENEDSCFPVLYGEKDRISLDFQNANIKNLFRIISEFSGFNLILSPEVSGFVNVRMFDLPWNEALEIILANSSLGRECFGNNAVRIASRETLEAEADLKAANLKDANIETSSENKDSCFPTLYGDKEIISLDFQNVHIKNLFRMISEVSGFNLILSPEVSGFVNVRMLDVPWNEALEIILANNALGRECFTEGVVRIASIKALNKAPKTLEAKKKSSPRSMGKELENFQPVAMHIYNKIQNEFPELLEKISRFEKLFNNKELLLEMSDDEYSQTVKKYKDILKSAGEIKISKTPLQEDYQLIRLKGIVSMKKGKVALFETQEKTGFSARKGDLIGPFFGYIDDIQPEKVVVVEKLRNYLGTTITRERSIEFSKDAP
ncbi:MAG: pilus assembly protein PilP [Nitrospinae bacterium]|nr:pilus assembly protein PilP [Nitrospinota bacterium]MBL7019270.1 pilus assembly protein PilP [Nitrospinaceae bacterium]